MVLENITEFDAQYLSDICKRTNTTSALFYNEKEPLLSFSNENKGSFMSFGLTKESPVLQKIVKRRTVYDRNKDLLLAIANISNLLKVVIDETNFNYPNVFIVFSEAYELSEDELFNVLFEYKLRENSKLYNVIPLSLDEIDEGQFPENAEIFTRKRANVQ